MESGLWALEFDPERDGVPRFVSKLDPPNKYAQQWLLEHNSKRFRLSGKGGHTKSEIVSGVMSYYLTLYQGRVPLARIQTKVFSPSRGRPAIHATLVGDLY